MNQTFSLTRFGMLFRKHTVENYRTYLMSAVVFTAIFAVVMALTNYNNRHPMNDKSQIVYYVLLLWFGGTVFTSSVFSNLGDKRKAIAALTLPGTALEKFLVGWVYSYIIFQVLFTGIFYAIDIFTLHIGKWPVSEIKVVDVFSMDISKIIFIGFAFLHAVVMVGSIYFKKMHFIKTAFVFFITGLLIVAANNKVLEWMITHDLTGNPPFTGIYARSAGDNYAEVSLNENTVVWVFALFILLTGLIWFSAYFKLKEKQV